MAFSVATRCALALLLTPLLGCGTAQLEPPPAGTLSQHGFEELGLLPSKCDLGFNGAALIRDQAAVERHLERCAFDLEQSSELQTDAERLRAVVAQSESDGNIVAWTRIQGGGCDLNPEVSRTTVFDGDTLFIIAERDAEEFSLQKRCELDRWYHNQLFVVEHASDAQSAEIYWTVRDD